ncbi:MAG: hypothetical protein ACYC9Y_07395 [Candidatus Methylomirabilia bacterium]
MRPSLRSAALLVVLLFAGCAAAPRQAAPSSAPPAWLATPSVWRIRQVVLIELGEMRFPLQGLLELDTATGTVRLAALDDFGVTLFRLTITRADERVDFLLPLVPQGAEVTRSVAASLRRIYLEPVAVAPGGAGVVLETGTDGNVAQAGPRGGGGWRVWYDEYGDADGLSVPRLIRFQQRGGASLTIRQESVKRVEK